MKKFFLVFIFFVVSISAKTIGKITYIKGKALIVTNDKNITATVNAPIEVNSTIITFKRSKVKLLFIDNTKILLGSKTKFKVLDYKYDKKNKKAKFKFFKGVFRSITGEIGHIKPQNFKLMTTTASIGIRGTIVLGEVVGENSLIACEQGAITVTSLTTGQQVMLAAGSVVLVSKTLMSGVVQSLDFLKNAFFNILPSSTKYQKNDNNSKSKKQKNIINLQKDNNLSEANITKKVLTWKDYPLSKKTKKTYKKELQLEKDIYEYMFRY